MDAKRLADKRWGWQTMGLDRRESGSETFATWRCGDEQQSTRRVHERHSAAGGYEFWLIHAVGSCCEIGEPEEAAYFTGARSMVVINSVGSRVA
jgi:hypothetical protein